jgi:hypothetical protein
MSDATVGAKQQTVILSGRLASSEAELTRLRSDESDMMEQIGATLSEKYAPGREELVQAQRINLNDVKNGISRAEEERASIEGQLAQLASNGGSKSAGNGGNSPASALASGLSSLLFGNGKDSSGGFSSPSLLPS